ncbi:Gfo/Idh/MocA family oxidoreductase [Ktedonosporobacter rubrisoli]|uniref:Gfo/Idh/MocA family oxidoreductase n=1 Tax=Ktedonosporobacter rubrisoli TaxID=2509675 RepID=A0A4P6JUK5_KTERU|nr:Gfo/Idh/MocA family oxidoreductase [Ktedonosporobacter rubrisoli]QBD79328.1 Gfo/Idh/MocA family oxidoreductase [Ktedonosporobacter rubrisoli]
MSGEKHTGPVRVGVIGLGWAGEQHLKAYQQLANVEIVAIAGLEEDRLAYLGKTYNAPHLYRYYEELLTRDDLDAVSIAVPNYLHAPIATQALARGFHVLCEKPLARTLQEGEEIVAAAVSANRVLHVVFNHRERNDIQVLKRYIDEGKLGRIYYAKAYWMRRRGIPGAGSWFGNKEMAGGGPLIDLGVHVLDMGLYLLGNPQVLTVSASAYSELGHRGLGVNVNDKKFGTGYAYDVEDLGSAFIRLANGATLLLEASWATHSNAEDDFGVVLYGTEGGAEIRVRNHAWQDTLRIYTDVAGTTADIQPKVTRGEAHLAVARKFVAAITEGEWSSHDGSEGLLRTRIIDACYTSAQQGSEVVFKM